MVGRNLKHELEIVKYFLAILTRCD